MNKKNKILIKIVFIFILIITHMCINSKSVYAENITTTLYPEDYTINNWNKSGAVGGSSIDDAWYYVTSNFSVTDATINIDIYGATAAGKNGGKGGYTKQS